MEFLGKQRARKNAIPKFESIRHDEIVQAPVLIERIFRHSVSSVISVNQETLL